MRRQDRQFARPFDFTRGSVVDEGPVATTLRVLPLFAVLFAGCGGLDRTQVTIHATDADAPIIEAFAEPIPFKISVKRTDDPADDAKSGRGDGINIGLVQDLEAEGNYRVDGKEDRYVVHGGGILGVQYGLAEALEAYGFRFFHPYKTRVPEKAELVTDVRLNMDHAPEMSVRGLHLHTLHPTEGYYDFWEPSEANRKNALRVIDWVIKNRGNYLQWAALDDIQRDPTKLLPWQEHSTAIVNEGHRRGIKLGIAYQLFGQSNLQKAWDLIDTQQDPPNPKEHMKERLRPLFQVPFDTANISFGEFSGADAERFLARVNDSYDALQEVKPGTDMIAAVHVGEDVTIEYQGQTLIYYFMVQYANPAIVALVHTVMYYNLFEDAGGAYHHNDFVKHREYLLNELKKGRRAAYYPESAYWVAFDNAIPTWLPLYVQSRWLDIKKLQEEADARGIKRLDEHVLFSTGWEWGYWQQDLATLRMNYEVTENFEAVAEWMFEPYAESGARLAAAVNATSRVQNQFLIQKRLAAYFASRDGLMDAGRGLKIVSQPDRPTFESISRLPPAELATFEDKVLKELDAFAAENDRLLTEIQASGMPAEDRWYKEILDGAAVNALRARFIRAAWSVPVKAAKGEDAQPALDELTSLINQAKEVVARRREGMHDDDFRRLIRGGENATVYPYGYLREADRLCFWTRELIEVNSLIHGGGVTVPSCVDVDLQ